MAFPPLPGRAAGLGWTTVAPLGCATVLDPGFAVPASAAVTLRWGGA